MREIWIYDIEVYKNLFSITLWKNDLSDKKVFLITNYSNQTIEIYEFLMTNSSKYLVGYNSIGYDDKVLRRFLYLYNTRDFEDLNRKLYEYSVALINDIASDFKIAYNQPWNSLDLMLIHRFHKLGVTLKQVGIILKCPKIQDLPYAYDKELSIAECNNVIEYNANDVFITWRLYKASLEEINLRKDISQSYGVSVLNSSRPNIADKIVTKYIRDKTGWNYDYLKDLRDTTDTINLNDIISPSISFKSKTLGDMLVMLRSSTVEPNNNNFEHSFVFDDSKYTLALGGLHSDNKPQIYLEDADYQLLDCDFGSFYTSLMTNLAIEPPQLTNVFLNILDKLTKERLLAKANKDSIKANTMKISCNSLYGKLGFSYGYLYSPTAMYKTTINGQLYLLQLIEKLSEVGIKCFYANTDGITCKVHKSKIDTYYEICNNYAKEINISIEFQQYKKAVIRDVNNFLVITSEGKLKKKGTFVTDTFDANWEIPHKNSTDILSKGFDAPVVAKAVEAYFVNGTPVREFITNHKDLYDFCKSQKVGGQFKVIEYSSLNGDVIEKESQKTNRYIISNRGSKLYKVNKESGQINDLVSGFYVTLFNDYVDNVDINYNYYVAEANKLIFPFENPQLSLF